MSHNKYSMSQDQKTMSSVLPVSYGALTEGRPKGSHRRGKQRVVVTDGDVTVPPNCSMKDSSTLIYLEVWMRERLVEDTRGRGDDGPLVYVLSYYRSGSRTDRYSPHSYVPPLAPVRPETPS